MFRPRMGVGNRDDPAAGESFGELAGTSRTVLADDAVPLQVTEGGHPHAPVTVVFSHGWTLEQGCWHYQWRDLASRARLVCYDQRGHGRSGVGSTSSHTVDQAGRDLHAVLSAAARGPVVLVGHSLGGMAIMALAQTHPELFGPVVTGVALVATSAGGLAGATLGLPGPLGTVVGRVLPPALRALRRRAERVERLWRSGILPSRPVIRWLAFGPRASATLVRVIAGMTGATPLTVLLDFYASLLEHDKRAALAALSGVPVRIVVGEHDLLTPLAHSRALAQLLPTATLEVVAGAGHMVILERPDAVTAALSALIADR